MIVLQNKPSDKDFLFNEMLLLLDNCLAGQKHLTITVFPENGQAFLLQPRPIKDFVNLSSNKDQNKISTISKKFTASIHIRTKTKNFLVKFEQKQDQG